MTFFTPSLTFISGKNILSNILAYVAAGALILLLIIILPCIVRILWQNIHTLATELHLAVLRNKKGGDAGAGAPPVAKVMRKEARHMQRRDQASGVPPWKFSSIYPPKPESAYFLLCAFTYTSDFMGGCPPLPL